MEYILKTSIILAVMAVLVLPSRFLRVPRYLSVYLQCQIAQVGGSLRFSRLFGAFRCPKSLGTPEMGILIR